MKLFVAVILFSILIASVSAQTTTGVLGTWRDINPTAYINPPANPPLDSVYMLNATEGWAVGDERFTTSPLMGAATIVNFASPAVLHYDGSTWNLVPVPKNPTEETNIPSGYALTSVNFGPPGQPLSRDDGWAVGCGFDTNPPGPAPISPPTCVNPPINTLYMTIAVALHWDGVSWRQQLSGLTGADAGPLQSVFMVSLTDVWAVGSDITGVDGKFWHWTGVPGLGGGWSLQGTALKHPLFSVFMVSPTEGWAVGAGGAIYHYFGGTWTIASSPVTTPTTLRSVFMISPTEGWAVGDDGSASPGPIGIIIHYSSGIWTGPVSPGTAPSTLRSVFMISSTEGWALGDAGTIVHYSGGTWTKLPINLVPNLPATAFNYNSIFMNTANDAWSVGTAGAILHYDGINWGTVTSPSLTELTLISFGPPLTGPTNPNDGWAVGRATPSLRPAPPTTPNLVAEPTIVHWNGFMWTKGVAIGTSNDLLSDFMLSTGDVWAVGGGGDTGGGTTASCSTKPCPIILHFTGGSWNTITPPPGSYVLTSVFMVNANEGWAVGCQEVDAGTTVLQCSPPAHALRTTGGSGIILHYTVTGGVGTWAIFPPPTTLTPLPPLNSVFMLGPNEGWAVGDSATVLHYTVTGGVGTWNVVSVNGLPTTSTPTAAVANLNSVFMLSPTSGWAVGGTPQCSTPNPTCSPIGPVIIYWDGTHWTPVATPTIPGGPDSSPPTLNSIYCAESDDCWTVGGTESGQLIAAIFHWDGVAWTDITLAPSLLGLAPLITPPTLNSVYMISPSNGWIVGSSPNFVQPPPQILTGQAPLSTILRFAPFGGVLTATETTTIVSTVSTQTTAVTSTITTSVSTVPGTVQITIKVVDSLGNAVQGATVSIPSLGMQGQTDSQGTVTFTVPLGTYTVTITKGSGSASPSINVVSSGQTFTLTLASGGAGPSAGIPGFPVESIAAGLFLGLMALLLARRKRRSRV